MAKEKNSNTQLINSQEGIMSKIRDIIAKALNISVRSVKVGHDYKANAPVILVNKEKMTEKETVLVTKSQEYLVYLLTNLA